MNTSKKYKEIFKLKKMLEDAEIPFDFFEMDPEARKIMPEFEHWHINYPNRGNFIVSAVEGFGTYGEQDDKIEIMGGLTEEEKENGDQVIGWLTAEEVFERIEKDYIRRNKTMKKVLVKRIDPDTLEITDTYKYVEESIDENKTEDDKNIDKIEAALPCTSEEFVKAFRDMKEAERKFEGVFNEFKKGLLAIHEQTPDFPKTIFMHGVKLTYVSPSIRNSIDSKKLKEEEPELAKKYNKSTKVSASIRIEETEV